MEPAAEVASIRRDLADVRRAILESVDESQCADEAERDRAVKALLRLRDQERDLLDRKRVAIYQCGSEAKRSAVLRASQETSAAIGEIMQQLQVLQDAQLETAEIALSLL